MSTLEWAIIITAIAGIGGTLIGGFVGAVFGRNSEKITSILLGFAAGVMISVVCFDLLVEAIEKNQSMRGHLFLVAFATIVGYFIVCLLDFLLDKKIEEKNKGNDKKSGSLYVAGIIMEFAIALHNFPEGMVLGASFAREGAEAVTFSASITLAVVIGLHNIPAGMSISVPLITGGMKQSKVVLVTALVGIPAILGAIFGYVVGSFGAVCLSLLLGFASGTMLYVVFGELIPEAFSMWHTKAPVTSVIVGIVVGMIIIFI